MSTLSRESRCFEVRGSVQGVGFRPFVYRLAKRHALRGWVYNHPSGVQIVVEGTSKAIDEFLQELQHKNPPLARIDAIEWASREISGVLDFQIHVSLTADENFGCVPADASVCDDCLRELFDPVDRRYRYPFINCTNCGPRFTIIESLPYDRPHTTMAAFSQCAACLREYHDPENRRFHAQPNACPACGPRLTLTDAQGAFLDHNAPIAMLASLLADGRIAALKSLGGFHLAVDAANEQAVRELRLRKHREEKPFAIMVRDVETARSFCFLEQAEADLLASRKSPIVLLRRRRNCPVAQSVSPGRRELGVMLAYTPLHHLLFSEFESQTNRQTILVMTSGNLTDEPIAYENCDAQTRLKAVTDVFLLHDRSIRTRCEDSVVRVMDKKEMLVRRARGYAPDPIPLPFHLDQPLLAVGSHLKNTFCIGIGQNAFLSPHMGNLDNYPAYESFRRGIQHFQDLFDMTPAIIAHDLHPDYLSTKYAIDQEGVRLIGVQHHHAHLASVLAEHGLKEPAIGVVFDGTGLGTDGHIWGAEFLIGDIASFERAAHLKYIPLPGGEQAVREPWRMAAVYLSQSFSEEVPWNDWGFAKHWPLSHWKPLQQMIATNLNCPCASSMGRLFDAISCLLTGRMAVTYEGQAAVELEMLVDSDAISGGYEFLVDEGTPLVINPRPVIRAVVDDLLCHVPIETVAMRFHDAVANLILNLACLLREKSGLNLVALSGGVFQNRILLGQSLERLRRAGFHVVTNNRVPCNDGGISLGQLAVAAVAVRGGA